jgi:NAD(P)-dependent dehydrogenase (short-subunit alcohol dehydrogenase family)
VTVLRVVITGANRGLGLELARCYAGRGDEVWAGCRRPAEAEELRRLTEHVVELDIASDDSIAGFADAVGDAALDVLINNAGVDGRALGVADDERDVLQLGADVFLDEIRINAVGPMLLSRRLLGPLRRAADPSGHRPDPPRIVNVSSTVGSLEVAATVGRDVGYVTSKAALNMISVKLAQRLRDDGIIAVAVHPGVLRTAIASPRMEAEDPAVGAAELVTLIDALTPDQSGAFLHRDGRVHPW